MKSPVHRGGKQKLSKGDIAREKILRAAVRIFFKKGFGEATFQDIADATGIRQSALFYYFPNKEALVEGVMRDVIGRGQDIISGKLDLRDDSRQRLRKYFRATLEWAAENAEDYQMLVLLYYYGGVRKEFSKLYGLILKGARERVLEILLAGQREGMFALPLGPEKTAEFLHDSLMGGVVNILSTEKSGMFEEHATKTWDAYLDQVTGVWAKAAK
jgi:AcrR family transcriptional regulator